MGLAETLLGNPNSALVVCSGDSSKKSVRFGNGVYD